MLTKASFILAAIFSIAIGARSANGDSLWTTTSSGTFDWNSSANWSGDFPPGPADNAEITNNLGSAQVITNMGGNTAIGSTNVINFIAVSNGLGSASITVEQAPGVYWQSSYGLQLGKNATLILDTGAILGTNSSLTFSLHADGAPGTLILSNASPTSGFTTFVNDGNAASIVNSGTIQFEPNNSQRVDQLRSDRQVHQQHDRHGRDARQRNRGLHRQLWLQ